MPSEILFQNGKHKNVLLEDFGEGAAVQANQHLIIDDKLGLILDPGGHKIYSKVLGETMSQLGGGALQHIFLSHQDPDIVAATNGWLMTTDADAWVSKLWIRFVPHFGLDRLVSTRLKPIPDEGMFLKVGNCEVMILPAHFMHSPGNFHIYDPIAKILYSGDLGASIGPEYREVRDFDAHIESMRGFHERYMATNSVLRAWVSMVRDLDVEIIAPQHGAYFRGKPMVNRFLDWVEGLRCGADLIGDRFRLPEKR